MRRSLFGFAALFLSRKTGLSDFFIISRLNIPYARKTDYAKSQFRTRRSSKGT